MNPREAIADLMYCAWKYDDKPHLLYACVRKLAERYRNADPDYQAVIYENMDQAYSNAAAASRMLAQLRQAEAHFGGYDADNTE